MTISTSYSAGDPLPASDVNEVNKSVLTPFFSGGFVDSAFYSSGSGLAKKMCMYSDEPIFSVINGGSSFTVLDKTSEIIEERDVTSDWASALYITGIVRLGLYLYVCMTDGVTDTRVYRYTLSSLSSGGTLMTETFLTIVPGLGASSPNEGETYFPSRMTSDGTDLFFTRDGGNSVFNSKIRKATISGTTLTSAGTITLNGAQYIEQSSEDSTFSDTSSGDKDRWGQNFDAPSGSSVLTGVKIKASRTSTANIDFELFNASSGVPSGSSIYSTSKTSLKTPTSLQDVLFLFNEAITAGNEYAFSVYENDSSPGIGINVRYYNSDSLAGSAHILSTNGGASYTEDTGKDLYFEVEFDGVDFSNIAVDENYIYGYDNISQKIMKMNKTTGAKVLESEAITIDGVFMNVQGQVMMEQSNTDGFSFFPIPL